MREQGGFNLHRLICPSVCLCVCRKTAVGPSEKSATVFRGESRNALCGLKLGGSDMRGAVPCLSADLTTHAVYDFSPCRVLKMGGNARVAQERREGRGG